MELQLVVAASALLDRYGSAIDYMRKMDLNQIKWFIWFLREKTW